MSNKNLYRISSLKTTMRRILRPTQMEKVTFYATRARKWRFTRTFRRSDASIEQLREDLKNKTLVFTVTAGRTGSDFCCNLMDILPNTVSTHEPEPAFQRVIREVQTDPEAAKRFWIEYKLPFIASMNKRNYVETSNVFGKGFFQPLLDLGLIPNLIILRREPRKIAMSYLERYCVPGRTKLGIEFLICPDDAVVLPMPGWRRMSDYQVIFWYALEMERRQEIYTEQLRQQGGKAVETSAQALNDPQNFLQVVRELDLLDPDADTDELLKAHAELSSRKHNKNYQSLEYFGDADAEEEAVWEAISAVDPGFRARVEARYSR